MFRIIQRWHYLAPLYLSLAVANVQAQRPMRYQPARPVLSPHLLYRQLDTTGVPNYYVHVRPATEATQQNLSKNYRPSAVGSRPPQMHRVSVGVSGRSGLPNRHLRSGEYRSVAAGFMNTSQFYPAIADSSRERYRRSE